MATASLAELKDDIKQMLVHRYIKRNYPFPQVFFTDDCCDDRALFQEIFEELEDAGIDLPCSIVRSEPHQNTTHLPDFIPPSHIPFKLTHKAHISTLLQEISNSAGETENYLISLDIEYDPEYMMHGIPKPPCLIQIEAFGKIILWQCATFANNRYVHNMPNELLEFLKNKAYTFFGSNINNDVRRLRNHCMFNVYYFY